MASRRKTRRSISVTGLVYQRLRKYCLANEVSCSALITDLVVEFLDRKRWPAEEVLDQRPEVKESDLPKFFHSGITTL